MKKLLAIIVTFVLICSLSISIVACKDGNQGKDAIIGKWINSNSTTYEFNKDNSGIITYKDGDSRTFTWGLSEKSQYNTSPKGTKYYFYFDSEISDVEYYNTCRGFDIMTDSDGKEYIYEIGMYGGTSADARLYKIS